jgi:hypothetical protein
MVLAALGLIIAATPIKVATIAVNELFKQSKVITLAEVESITFVAKTKIATAKILKTYKGKPTGQTVKFVAQETWACDISNAIKGEKVLLYLVSTSTGIKDEGVNAAAKELATKGEMLYSIGHAGRGRIPILSTESEPTVPTHAADERGWSINLNLEVPDSKHIQKISKDLGTIKISDLITYQ